MFTCIILSDQQPLLLSRPLLQEPRKEAHSQDDQGYHSTWNNVNILSIGKLCSPYMRLKDVCPHVVRLFRKSPSYASLGVQTERKAQSSSDLSKLPKSSLFTLSLRRQCVREEETLRVKVALSKKKESLPRKLLEELKSIRTGEWG